MRQLTLYCFFVTLITILIYFYHFFIFFFFSHHKTLVQFTTFDSISLQIAINLITIVLRNFFYKTTKVSKQEKKY